MAGSVWEASRSDELGPVTLRDGWTVLCGFEYCDGNRFFGIGEVCDKPLEQLCVREERKRFM